MYRTEWRRLRDSLKFLVGIEAELALSHRGKIDWSPSAGFICNGDICDGDGWLTQLFCERKRIQALAKVAFPFLWSEVIHVFSQEQQSVYLHSLELTDDLHSYT